MASLQAALKQGIQAVYQLEDNELAAEPLPDEDRREQILFYEAAEGGAGVLRRLLGEPTALATVARAALEICHFDPDSGANLRRAPRAREDCEAACYDCLMSYSNQRDHASLDRLSVRDLLLGLAGASVTASSAPLSRGQQLLELERQCASGLEREWLRYLEQRGHRLPSQAQALIERCQTRPDFVYDDHYTVVYVDGPHHAYPERQTRDATQVECLEDLGYTVVRFEAEANWDAILADYPNVFGQPS
jgi:very-short-patch-repair endonuclease